MDQGNGSSAGVWLISVFVLALVLCPYFTSLASRPGAGNNPQQPNVNAPPSRPQVKVGQILTHQTELVSGSNRKPARNSPRMAAPNLQAPSATAGLVITPTFDSSITGNPNAVTIEGSINAAIAILQARF